MHRLMKLKDLPWTSLKFILKSLTKIRKGGTWAIAVRRGSYKSLFLLNSGRFSLEKKGNSVLNFGSRKTV